MAESPGVAAGGATLSPRPCVRRQLAARPGEGGGPTGQPAFSGRAVGAPAGHGLLWCPVLMASTGTWCQR